jgi:hypothetical protein
MAEGGYLEKLDGKIRRASGEVWGNEAARDGFVFGLMAARQTYTGANLGVPYDVQLADVLGAGFERPAHKPGCRGHRHGQLGCLERGCSCMLAIRRTAVSELAAEFREEGL